jgi:hypothetical protein
MHNLNYEIPFSLTEAILAYNRSREFIYAYFAVNMLAGMFAEGCMQCLSLAYVVM